MAIPLREITGMPAFSSCYPMPPCRYRQARFQLVFFRADPGAVDRVLPECFTPVDGWCVAMGLAVPWSSSYGAFEESALSVPCAFEGRSGYFCAVAFLNSRSSIPAGREIYGTPKVHAEIAVSMDERVMCTDTVGGRGFRHEHPVHHAPGGPPRGRAPHQPQLAPQGDPPGRRPRPRGDAGHRHRRGQHRPGRPSLPRRRRRRPVQPLPPSSTSPTSPPSPATAPGTWRWTTPRATARWRATSRASSRWTGRQEPSTLPTRA